MMSIQLKEKNIQELMVMKWLQVLLLDIQEIKIKRKLQRNTERLSIIHFL